MKPKPRRVNGQALPNLFRQKLAEEFQQRRIANPRFSQRAFSKLLGIPNATLSYMLDGSRQPSSRTFRAVGDALLWPPGYRQALLEDLSLNNSNGRESPRFRAYLDSDAKLLEDPVTFALKALSRVPNIPSDPERLAEIMAVTPARIKKSLDILLQYGWIEIKNDYLLCSPLNPALVPADNSGLKDFKNARIQHLLNLKQARDGFESHTLLYHLALTPGQVAKLGQKLLKAVKRLQADVPPEEGAQPYYGLFAIYPFVDAASETPAKDKKYRRAKGE